VARKNAVKQDAAIARPVTGARYVWRPDQARPAEVDLPRPDRVISGLLDGAIRRDGGVARDEQRRQQTAWDHPVTIQT